VYLSFLTIPHYIYSFGPAFFGPPFLVMRFKFQFSSRVRRFSNNCRFIIIIIVIIIIIIVVVVAAATAAERLFSKTLYSSL